MSPARRCLVLALALLAAACGPVGPFSGGALSGESKPAPSDWSFFAKVEHAQLETNPADLHSVNVWLGSLKGGLQVASSMIRGPKLPTERETGPSSSSRAEPARGQEPRARPGL